MDNFPESSRRDVLLSWAEKQLAGVADSPRREARLLLCRAAGLDTTALLAFPERAVADTEAARFRDWIVRRARHEPVAHLIGERGFRGLDLAVTPATLIPRPDTECLVETALRHLPNRGVKAVDLGTGSGAVALALAAERPDWDVTATERSDDALAVARRNAEALGLAVRFLAGHWFQALPTDECFDLIISNPPYIAADDPHLNAGDLPWEPRSALVSGRDGLDDIRHLVAAAPAWLNAGGWLMLEHGCEQARAVQNLFKEAGFRDIQTAKDLGDRDRVTLGQLPA